MHWTDQLHKSLIAIADQINRLDMDKKLLAEAGISMDRALFPLLCRIAVRPQVSVAELANVVGRDHSTVSRQVIKLEELGLIHRLPDPTDRRARQLFLSDQGQQMMQRISAVRRSWMETHFAAWAPTDRDRLIALMTMMTENGPPHDGNAAQ